jgi:Family of unknown function (DUF5682)
VSIHVFGVRHHGPGCARSLKAALEKLQPDIVLVEGPPDAQETLPLLARKGMKPPVALLIYRPDQPRYAVYYPFAHFSPEWQALRHAVKHNIPARFIDLPQSIQLANPPDEDEGQQKTPTVGVEEQGQVAGQQAASRPLARPRPPARGSPTIRERALQSRVSGAVYSRATPYGWPGGLSTVGF